MLFLVSCNSNKTNLKNLSLNGYGDYIDKTCTDSSECGGLPCLNGKCLVQPCTLDEECPNGMCGLHATPTPGYCATVDVI